MEATSNMIFAILGAIIKVKIIPLRQNFENPRM
jgi:hypothetical protein